MKTLVRELYDTDANSNPRDIAEVCDAAAKHIQALEAVLEDREAHIHRLQAAIDANVVAPAPPVTP